MWGILSLWSSFFIFFAWLGGGFFFQPLWFMLSGGYFRLLFSGYFSGRFHIIHAGFALDQPTIGKYLFWFAFFSAAAVFIAICGRLANDLTEKKSYWAFAIPFLIAMLTALAQLLTPAALLAHYIYDMGITPRRFAGAVFVAASAAGWIFLARFFLRRTMRIIHKRDVQ